MNAPVILASGSSARAGILRRAGVEIEVHPAIVDEAAIKQALLAEKATPRDIADQLAEFKARRVCGRFPDRLVLGADQVLVCEGRMFDKPADLDEARRHLMDLRGKTHELLSATVFYERGLPVWRHIGRARLTMRPFSDAFLDQYLETQGDVLLTSVGAYMIEDRGSQLFSRIEGDHFTVLGLPLLEILGFLRMRGICLE